MKRACIKLNPNTDAQNAKPPFLQGRPLKINFVRVKNLCLLIIVLIAFPSSFAQISKEHSFVDQSSVDIQIINLEKSGSKILLENYSDSITYQYKFYNLDYSLFKTININLGALFAISDYKKPRLNISFIAEHLFDADDDIDMLGELEYFDASEVYYSQVVVFHENGNTLFASDIENTNAWLVQPTVSNSTLISSLIETPEGAKLILDVYYFNDELFEYEVYSLPGSLTDIKQSNILKNSTLNAYPNPVRDYLHLEYDLADNKIGAVEVIDNSGRVIKTFPVNNRQGVLRVDVSDLRGGLYYYKLNSKRGVPRTKKVVVLD